MTWTRRSEAQPRSACEPLFDWDLHKLAKVKRGDVARRFALGAAASGLAGLVTQLFGSQAGGLFLAFPAILAASLTLLETQEGHAAAVASSEGAVLGALGLVMFAFVFEAAFDKGALWWALLLAISAWIGTSVALYAVIELARRRQSS